MPYCSHRELIASLLKMSSKGLAEKTGRPWGCGLHLAMVSFSSLDTEPWTHLASASLTSQSKCGADSISRSAPSFGNQAGLAWSPAYGVMRAEASAVLSEALSVHSGSVLVPLTSLESHRSMSLTSNRSPSLCLLAGSSGVLYLCPESWKCQRTEAPAVSPHPVAAWSGGIATQAPHSPAPPRSF